MPLTTLACVAVGVASDLVVSGTTGDVFDIEEGVGALTCSGTSNEINGYGGGGGEISGINAGTTVNDVIASTGIEEVISIAAIEIVIAATANELVFALTTLEVSCCRCCQ